MYKKLLSLEIKNFFRNKDLGTNIALKILMFFFMIMMCSVFFFGAIILHKYATKTNVDPLLLFSAYFVYYWAYDLVIRYFFQQMPTQNLKPFLTLNIKKKTLLNYTVIKTFTSFFNWGNLIFFIPFAVLLIRDGHSVSGVLMWLIGMMSIFYFNNFLNILLNGKDYVVYIVGLFFLLIAGADYYGYFKLSEVSQTVFHKLYQIPFLFLIPVAMMMIVGWLSYITLKENFYLDKGLELKKSVGKTQNIDFLNRYGAIGTFLNNDIRLLTRSKAAKNALLSSFLFLFYGLLMFSTPTYKTPYMMMFLGLFVTGGFMFIFGQRVPGWDSSYYPLMMTSNVPYKKYLESKWWLLNVVTIVSMIIATFYIYFGWKVYITFFAAGLYNIGVNSHLTLLSGAFNKAPIDLNSKVKAMGEKNAFNLKTILITLPKIGLPMLVFGIGNHFFGLTIGVCLIAILGIIGVLLRNKVFNQIVKTYRKEKYSTLSAFKDGN